MRILFICGSLEQGKDGVGDYTRRLAGELNKLGHSALIIALYDRFVSTIEREIQNSEGINFEVLRIPYLFSVTQRIIEAKKWVNKCEPEWLSLQFVPFSYHKKGLSWSIQNVLYKIGQGRKWHIMFHELWVGMDKNATKKIRFWSYLQQYFIKALIFKLQPKIVHTQTHLYIHQLNKLGFTAIHLPLFGNIANLSKINNDDLQTSVKGLAIVVFGNIHLNAPIKSFAEELTIFSNQNNLRVIVRFVGRCGNELGNWVKSLKFCGLEVEVLGEQPPEYISRVLRFSDFGISTTPMALIEKSGAAAAMREHCLPIISVAKQWLPRGIEKFLIPFQIIEYKKGNIANCLQQKINHLPAYTVSNISQQFVSNLSNIMLWQV